MVPAISEKILHIYNKIDIHRPPYDAMQDRTAAALRRMQRTAGQSEQEMPGHASGTTSPNDTGCRGHLENTSPPQGRKRTHAAAKSCGMCPFIKYFLLCQYYDAALKSNSPSYEPVTL